MKENATWLGALMDIKFRGDNPDRFVNAEKYINKLTVKDVQQVAKLILMVRTSSMPFKCPRTTATSLSPQRP